MRIEHIAIWVSDLELMKSFYESFFNATSNERYTNVKKQFHSYFLSFENGCRLELMQRPDVSPEENKGSQQVHGYTHMALSVGSREKVDQLTERLRRNGYEVIGEPRTTGDGYYESVILDPEKNQVEITI